MAKHLIKHWRGSRENYNLLKSTGLIDFWTLYYVVDTVGTESHIVEYFGNNVINQPTGQVLAVNDLLTQLPSSANPYDRFLVGNDVDGYKIYEYTPISGTSELSVSEMNFDWKYGVRILSKGLKNYVYYNSHLKTYDDIDCGEF